MKKLRSTLPRRKRSTYSPIFKPSVTSFIDSSSNLTGDVSFSCNDSSSISISNKPLKKRSFSSSNDAGFGEFRRITRSYREKLEVELSEASSCVELCDSSSKSVVRKGSEVLRYSEAEDDENDVVSVSSRRDYPQAKYGTSLSYKLSDSTVNELLHGRDNEANDVVSVSLSESNCSKSGKITSYVTNSVNKQTVEDDEVENCGESKLISTDIDLTCSEQFSCGDEESGYSSAGCTGANMESSEFEISSGFLTSSWFDSGSQFSERSVGDPIPSPTFQLYLIYRQKFCKSEFSTKVFSGHCYNETSNGIIKLLRPEDEEHEESYWMMKERERRQVYLHDYAEEYCEMTEYGDLVVQQRLQMVHWIMEQSANKDLQKETTFLSVSLLDRFLSKGYFRSKMELEIAGIACLTLATRIEENQPYNSIQQKVFNVGSNEYRRSEVVAMEWLVQDVLSFQCYLPTIYNFLWFYLRAARSNEDVDKTAKYLAVLALLGHEQLCYWPSTVAASLVSIACLAGNEQSSLQQIAWIHNGSNDKDLPDCIKSLEWLVQYI